MACDKENLWEYLADFSAQRPIEAVYCPFAQSGEGAGLGVAVVAMFIFGFLGLGLTIRTRHPGPILVAMMLSAGAVASQLPGIGAKVAAIVLFFGLGAVSLYIYQRAQSTF